jgi:hypothetical protein
MPDPVTVTTPYSAVELIFTTCSYNKTSALCPEYVYEFRMIPRIIRQYGPKQHYLAVCSMQKKLFTAWLELNITYYLA